MKKNNTRFMSNLLPYYNNGAVTYHIDNNGVLTCTIRLNIKRDMIQYLGNTTVKSHKIKGNDVMYTECIINGNINEFNKFIDDVRYGMVAMMALINQSRISMLTARQEVLLNNVHCFVMNPIG